ncbi:MAG: autotransporter-associated beta strand repeat-containing protein, partial [Akkermansia sp.]|nr:autotransporter-associated beta strand repeat-containing protein [Akkermansia sp.]
MKRTPFLSRILSILGTVVAVTLTPQEVAAGTMHSDVPMPIYMDFGQNMGRYAVGSNVNALLGHIRQNVDGGIVIHYTDGTPSYTISNTQGMIDYSAVHDGGYAAAMGPNMIATVAHNGEINGSFAERVVGSEHAINYSAVGVRYSHQAARDEVVFRLVPTFGDSIFDYCLQRQTKVFTDISWSPMSTITDVASMQGKHQYHAGAGSMNMWSETDGKYHFNQGSLIGSIKTINITSNRGHDCWIIISDPNYGNGVGASTANPLPIGTEGGDSGSPVFIYNSTTGQYEYFVAHEGGTGISSAQGWGNIKWSHETLQRFNVSPDMSSGEVHLQAITSAGEYYADKAGNSTTTYYGYATDAAGNILTQYNGVRSGLNTWSDLSGIRNLQNWYAWNSDAYIQQSDVDLFFTENLVFNATQAENKVVLDATVDLGIGYAEFNAGELEKARFTISSAAGENNMFNHAGYVINEGAEVHLQLTNPEDYMTEWRKTGAGDLYIDGTGNTNALLAVGGSGKTYLQQKDGWAAYNVIVGSGATVVISDISQIARDLTIGNDGGVLDMNGQSMDWYSNNPNVQAAGFSINALTEGAIITNSTGTTTLTYKESGQQTWLGSFVDTKEGALRIVYNGGGTWTMHSIHTDLSHHADSGLSVASGKVVLAGTNTVHGKGSETGHTGNRLFLENDWHYADAKMNVSVADGATFELGSHARLKGNISVAAGGTFIMREGVHDRYEYVEGGIYLEDTYQYADFYGLKGDIALSGEMQVAYSAGTTTNTTLSGSLSGAGTLTVAAGTTGGILTLAGDNSAFTGKKSISSGGVIATSLAALGSADQQWLIGKQGWLASHGFTEGTDILSHIDAASAGTLALSNDLTTKLDFSEHSGLFLGAETGKTVQYGAEGTSDVWTAVGDNYLLGGGGGTLVVNYKLTGADTGIILGADASSTGKVVLANTGNDFGGFISFAGTGVILETAQGAMSNANLQLSYGNSLLSVTPGDDVSRLTADSDGIILVDKIADTDIELVLPTYMAADSITSTTGLAVGASVDTVYTGKLTLAADAAYQFSSVNGATLTLDTTLSDAHDMIVDAQGYTGGTVILAGNESYAGNITVQGNRDTAAAGDITLAFGRDTVLSGDITLKTGGTLDVAGHHLTLSGNVIDAGGSLVNSSWSGPLDTEWSGTLTLHAESGQSRSIAASISTPLIYKTGAGNVTLAAANTYTDMYLQGGTLTVGQADALSIYGTVHMSGGATLDLATYQLSKNTYMNAESIIVESGSATVQQSGAEAGHVSLIQGNVLLNEGTELHLQGAGIYELSGTRFGGENAVLHVDAPRLRLQSGSTLHIDGTLSYAANGTLHSQATNNGMTRNINRLQMLNGATLTLSEQGGTNYWQVNSLSGEGTLQWNSTTNHVDGNNSTASRLVIADESDFAGSIRLNRSNGNANHTHGAYIELAHDKAAQYADISLSGADARSWASLAVNTADATICGLSGNEYSFTYAGAAVNTRYTGENHPASTRQSTLTINTAAGSSYTYAGVVGHSADTPSSGLSLVKLGAGNQTFSGTSYLADVSVQGGSLSFVSGNTVVNGDVAVAGGAVLSGIDFILSDAKTFTVLGGDTAATAQFSGTLNLAGGTLEFDGYQLMASSSEGVAALTVGGLTHVDGTDLTISLTNMGNLTAGSYTLATGDWSGIDEHLTLRENVGYDAVFSTNASGHLLMQLALRSGTHVWDGTSDSHTWSTTQFGSSSNALAADAIVLFTDTAGGRTVSVSENVEVQQAHFQHNNGEYTVESNGGMATIGSLSKSGSGTLTLQSGVVVTGDATISRGELILQSTNLLQGSVSGDGTLVVDWGTGNSDGVSLVGLQRLELKSGTFAVTGSQTLGVNEIQIQNGAALEHNAGVNYTGSLVVNGGTYRQASGVDYAGHITLDGGILALAGGSLTGTLDQVADASIQAASGTTSWLNMVLSQNDDAVLIQTGGGNIDIVSNSRTQLQNYIVREGTLTYSGYYNHTNQGTITVEDGAMLKVGWGAGLVAKQINLAGGATLKLENGATAWWLSNNVNTKLLVEDGAMISGSATGTGSYINGSISGSGTLNLYNASTGADAYTVNSVISDGAEALGLHLTNTNVTLTGANTYSGGTIIDANSSVTATNISALGNGAVQNGGSLVMESALMVGGISGQGTLATNGQVLILTNSADNTYTGTVSGQGAILQIGTGRSKFSGTADVSSIGVSAGSLSFTGSATISSGGIVAEGASLSFDGTIALGEMIENAGVVNIGTGAAFELEIGHFVNGAFTLVTGSGRINYAEELTLEDFTIVGYDFEELANRGVEATISQTSSQLSLSFSAFLRDLVWSGQASAEWNGTDGNWNMGDNIGVVYGVVDNVTFDASSSVREVTLSGGIEVANMNVVAGDYVFSGTALNVQSSLHIADGASATLNTMPTSLGVATVDGTLNLAFTGTWTQELNAANGVVNKTSSGTLTWDAEGVLSIGTLNVNAGILNISADMEVGELNIAGSSQAYLTNNAAADALNKTVSRVHLSESSKLLVYNKEATTNYTTVDEVIVAGAATIQDYAYQSSYVGLNTLGLAEGITSSSLTLGCATMGSDVTVFNLGAEAKESGDFVGTIALRALGVTNRGALILSHADIAANSVITMSCANDTQNYAQLGLGIHAERTTIAGLNSTEILGTKSKLFSGAYKQSAGYDANDAFDSINFTDVAERTLVINTAAGSTHTFYGEVLSTVNIEKQGSGTQVLAGTVGSTKLSVLGGTLSLAGATISSGALAQVELGRGATLQHSLAVDGAHALKLTGTSGATGTATLSGDLVLGGGTLSFDTAWLSETEASLTVTGGISLAEGVNTQTITMTSGTGLMQGGSYLLLAGDFAAGITAENFTLAGLSGAVAGSLSLADGGLWLSIGVSETAHVWSGTDDAHVWSGTMYGTAVAGVLTDAVPATFDDSAANRNVLIEGAVSAPGGIVFDNTEAYNISSSNINSRISTTSFALTNTGTVTLGVALDAQSMSLSQGTLVLRDGATLTDGVQVSMDNGATLDMTSTTQSFSALSMAEGTTITDFYGSGTLTIKDPVALNGTINVGTIKTQGEVSLTVGDNTHTLHVQSGSTTLRGELVPANLVLDANTTLTAEQAVNLGSSAAIRAMGGGITVAADVAFSGGSLFFDNAALSESAAALAFTGTLSRAENGTVKVAVADIENLRDGGTWVLATGDWAAFSDSSFVFDYKAPELASFSISGNTLSMTLAAHRIWAGTSADYQWNSTAFGADAACPAAAIALFDDTAENTHIRLTESVSVGEMYFDHNNAYSITAENNAAITNAGNLNKSGSGALLIDARLYMTGGITQTGGTVTLSGDGSVLGDYTIRNASTLNIEGSGISMGKLYALRLDHVTSTINVTGGSASFSSIDLESYTTLNFLKPQGADTAEYTVAGRLGFTSAWATGSTRVLVEEGVKLKLGSIHSPWGWGSFEINGDVEVAGAISLSSGTEEPITGTGSLTAGSLSTGNSGTYVFDVARTTITGAVNINGQTQLRSGVFTSESQFTQSGSTLTIDGGTLNLNGASSFSGGILKLASGKINVQSGAATISNTVDATGGEVEVSGGTLKLTDATAHALLQGVDSFTLAGGTLDLAGVDFSSSSIVLKQDAAFAFHSGVIALGNLETGKSYTIFDASQGTITGWQALSAQNFSIGGINLADMGRVQLTLGDSGTFSYTQTVYDLTWTGAASSTWNATDANWQGGEGVFANGDHVTFASNAEVHVDGTMKPASLTLNEGVSVTLSGNTLMPYKLTLHEGASLLGKVCISSGLALTLEGNVILGDLSLADGGNLTLSPAEGKSYTIGSLSNVATLSMQGRGILNLGNASLTNLEFATRTTWASRIGELNIKGTVQVSDLLSVGWGTLNLASADAQVTTKRFRASTYGRQATSIVNINGGSLMITGEHDGTSEAEQQIAFLLAHWNDASTTINLNSGSLTSEKAVMYMGWDSCGNFNALGGEASLKGIQFSTVRTEDVDTFALGTATSGNAVVNIGSFGIKGMASTDVVRLGHGTLKAAASFSIAGNSPIFMVATASEACPGTIFDTNGNSITVETAVSGNGAMVKRGEGTLAFTAASTGFTGSVAVEAGTLQVDATSASLLEGASALTLSGGTLDLSFIDSSAAALTLAQGATYTFTRSGVIALGDLQAGTTYHIFDASAGTLSGWDTLGVANFTLGGTAMADMGRVKLTLGTDGSFAYAIQPESQTLTWAGTSTSSVWDTSTTNWNTDAGNNVEFIEGDDVIFGSGEANKNVTLKGSVTVGKMTVNADGYSFAPADANSSASITMDEWEVSVTNSENQLKLGTGTGTLNVTVNESSSVTGAVDLYWGTTLNLKGLNHEIERIIMRAAGTGSTLNISSATATIDTIEMRNTSTLTFGLEDGSVAGDYEVKNLTIGNNGNTRTINIYEGAEVSVGTMALNTSTNAGEHTTTLSGKGTLGITTLNVTQGTLNITNSLTTITTANLTGGTVNFGDGSTTVTTVNVNSGAAEMGMAEGCSRGNVTVSGGLNIENGATLTSALSMVLDGTLSIEQGGTWTLNGGIQSLTETQLSGIQGTLDVGSAATLKMTNKTTAKNNVSTALDHVVGAGTVVLDYAIEQYDNGIGFNFSGFTGTVQVDRGRVLISSSTFNTTEGAAQPAFKLTSADSQLVFNDTGTVLKSDVELAADTTFHVNSTKSATISGEMSGSGGFTKAGAGSLTLSGANTYTGATTVSGGTLELTGAVSMAAQSNISLASGTTLLLNATNETAMTLGNAVSGTGTIHKKGAYETVLSGNVAATTINVKDGTNQATNAGTLTLSGDTVKADTLYAAYGTVNVGDGTDATSMQVTRMELGDSSATAGSASLNVKAASTLTVTGSNNGSDYKSASLLLAEWEHGTNLNVAGKLLAPNAKALVGDNVANITIANGGVMAVKGMGVASVKDGKSQEINVTLQDGGTLILGSEGIDTAKTFTGTLGAGTVGMSAATTTIAEDVT